MIKAKKGTYIKENDLVCTIPVGFRPVVDTHIVGVVGDNGMDDEGFGKFTIYSDGRVVLRWIVWPGTAENAYWVDGVITFPTEM